MFVLSCEITIGSVFFTSVNSVEIERSIYKLSDTAKIEIPVTAMLKQTGIPTTKVETAQQIKVGDAVVIKLGYGDELETEFVGYVKSVNLTTPLEIICENEFFQTRRKSITLSGTTTLKDILQKLGLSVGYAEDLKIKNFVCPNMSHYEVLTRLNKDFGLLIFFDAKGKIYATRASKVQGDTVKYILRENVINDNSLQYHRKEDMKLKIDCVCYKSDGTEVKATKGDDGGAIKTVYFYNVENVAELSTLADMELKKHSYDGYDGEIETFLQPFCQPCDIASIEDKIYFDRSGNYIVTGVKVKFGVNGARREISIGETV